MLEISNLRKYYSSHMALQIDNLNMAEAIYWIKGENGSGKSTMLKCLAGLLSFQGDIFFNKKSFRRDSRAYLKEVNYAPTEASYPDFLLGSDLSMLFIRSKGGSLSVVDEMVEGFRMESFFNNIPISEYSSGMLKKLSLLLAFIGQTGLVLLDEPYVTLDLEATYFLNSLILKKKAQGSTILLTSHVDKLPFESVVLLLSGGKLMK